MSTRANSTCWPKAAGGRLKRTPCGASGWSACCANCGAMRKSLPKRDQLLLRIGAAKKEAGRAFGFVKILMPPAGQAVTRETFSFQVDKAKLKATEQRDGHYLLRSNLTGEHPAVLWTRYVQLTQIESVVPLVEKRTEHPAHRSSTGTSGRRARG